MSGATTKLLADTDAGYSVSVTMMRFSPAEAERITLVSNEVQRNWRRRGYLAEKRSAARASWDLFSLAELMVMHLLSARVGPLLARPMATVCAHGIAWHALSEAESYEGDSHLIFSWDSQKFAAINQNIAKARAIVAKLDRKGAQALGQDRLIIDADIAAEMIAHRSAGGPGWADQADWLRTNIFRSKGIDALPERFFCWWADGSHAWRSSLDAAFNAGTQFDPRFEGSVLVLDLEALGFLIGKRAGRAFVNVELN